MCGVYSQIMGCCVLQELGNARQELSSSKGDKSTLEKRLSVLQADLSSKDGELQAFNDSVDTLKKQNAVS